MLELILGLMLVVLLAGCAQNKAGSAQPERSESVTLKGDPVTLVGSAPSVGEPAPDFKALNSQLEQVALSDFSGRPVLISSVPSLDTPVCSLQTKRFNEELAKLPEKVAILTISMDSPFAQKRFCSTENVERITVLSDTALRQFGTAYGVQIKDLGLLARAVFVVDPEGRLTHKEIVPEISEHPDYDAAMAALKEAAGID